MRIRTVCNYIIFVMLAVTVCTYRPGSDSRIRAMYDVSGVGNRERWDDKK
jgi:hypothetical protein